MKIRSLFAVALVGWAISAGTSLAGNGWGSGYCPPPPQNCGPRWGGSTASFGITFGAPVTPVYRRVYYQPAPVIYQQAPVIVTPAPTYYSSNYGPNVLVSAQSRLYRLGYYRGAVDGEFGPQTSRAIQHYQVDNGLPVTGRLDGRTLASLGI